MRKLLIPLAVAAIAIFCWYFIESDQDVIIRRIRELNAFAQIKKAEHPLVIAGQSKEIVAFADSRVKVDLTSAGAREVFEKSNKELQRQLLQIGTQFTKLETSVDRFRVDIEGQQASVELRASALGSLKGHEGDFLEIRRIKLVLIKRSGVWLIKEVIHLENLRDEKDD